MSAPPPDPAIANADLWSAYFQQQWRAFLNPFGVRAESPVAQLADGAAARISGFLTLLAAGPIAWLFEANAPQVSALARRDAIAHPVAIPARAQDEAIEPAA